MIRRFPADELADRRAQRPDVARWRGTFEGDDLGRHPIRGTIRVVRPGRQSTGRLDRMQIQRDAEVGQLDVAVLRGENVGG